MSDCIFCRIVRGEIPCGKIYEDEDVLAFKDIHPQAPVHFLIIPKRHFASLAHALPSDAPLLGHMLALAPRLAAIWAAQRASRYDRLHWAGLAGRKCIICTFTWW